MTKSDELISKYRINSPLHSKDLLHKQHVQRITDSRTPSAEYDLCILEARRKATRAKADDLLDSREVPEGSSTSRLIWKARRPDSLDVERLEEAVGYPLDPTTQAPAVRAAMKQARAGRLTIGGYYDLAHLLLSQKPAL